MNCHRSKEILKLAGAYILPLFPPPGGGNFFKSKMSSGEVFQDGLGDREVLDKNW